MTLKRSFPSVQILTGWGLAAALPSVKASRPCVPGSASAHSARGVCHAESPCRLLCAPVLGTVHGASAAACGDPWLLPGATQHEGPCAPGPCKAHAEAWVPRCCRESGGCWRTPARLRPHTPWISGPFDRWAPGCGLPPSCRRESPCTPCMAPRQLRYRTPRWCRVAPV